MEGREQAEMSVSPLPRSVVSIKFSAKNKVKGEEEKKGERGVRDREKHQRG